MWCGRPALLQGQAPGEGLGAGVGVRVKRRFGRFAVDCLSRSDLVARARADLAAGQGPVLVFDINGHALSLAETDPSYRRAIAAADLIHADGGFLVTLSRLLPGPEIPERSATTDMIDDFAADFATTGHSFYLLGGTEEVNRRAAEILSARYPGLRIVGRRNGYFTAAEEAGVIAEINAARPDVLWVGLGKPKEQQWCATHARDLQAGWVVTCGGCFNFVTGDYVRAPLWMQRANLEWLHRLATNPRKLLRRYLVTTPHALWIALRRPQADQASDSA